MMPKRKRKSALRRRYGRAHGHFGIADIRAAGGHVRQFVAENPALTAAALGGAVGATAAGISPGAAALVGAATGVVGQKMHTRCKRPKARGAQEEDA